MKTGLIGVVVKIGLVLFRSRRLHGPAILLLAGASLLRAADTVAVLPSFNETNNANLDWIGESVAETLREAFAGAGVLVLSREERVEVYRRLAVRSGVPLTRATVLRIGEALDAGHIVFGQFDLTPPQPGETNSRGTLKLTANIIDAKNLRTGPQFFESGRLEDLSLLESRLAWQCLYYFRPHTAPAQNEFLKDRPPVRIDAVESYVRGLLSEAPESRQKLFAQAARLDARYSEPAFQLGRMAFEKKSYRTALDWLSKVAPGDSHYHEAQFLLGLCRYYEGDLDGAIQTLQTVASNVPLNEVFNDLGAAQSRKNRPEALENFKKALEGDEADPDYWFNLGYAQWKSGQVADASRSFKEVLARTPDDEEAKDLLARCKNGDLPHSGETLNAERIKNGFEETVYLQLRAELKK